MTITKTSMKTIKITSIKIYNHASTHSMRLESIYFNIHTHKNFARLYYNNQAIKLLKIF